MKEGDFVELQYTGNVDGFVFDTTDKDVAKKNGLPDTVKPVIICVGKGALLEGIERSVVGKTVGEPYSVTLEPKDAFGMKDAKNIQLVPTAKFKKEGLNPYPGMQVEIDGRLVVVKRVSGGRTLVDFNHPLAGKTVVYDITILRSVTDPSEKLSALIPGKTSFKDGIASIPEFPEQLRPEIEKQIKDVMPEVTSVSYVKEEV
ncbi:MAG: FKBP-type peptidyl-prolyl cis-trans isomerase [Candidatus Woesearchaeota archaeon]